MGSLPCSEMSNQPESLALTVIFFCCSKETSGCMSLFAQNPLGDCVTICYRMVLVERCAVCGTKDPPFISIMNLVAMLQAQLGNATLTLQKGLFFLYDVWGTFHHRLCFCAECYNLISTNKTL